MDDQQQPPEHRPKVVSGSRVVCAVCWEPWPCEAKLTEMRLRLMGKILDAESEDRRES